MSKLRGIDGRLVLISGAGQGIGRVTAERLASEGARVLVNDINPETAQIVADRIGGTAVPFDVSDAAAVDLALTRIEAEHGVVTLLVANHAYMTMAPFVDHSEFDFERHLTVNLIGTALLMQRCLPGMVESGYGRDRCWLDARRDGRCLCGRIAAWSHQPARRHGGHDCVLAVRAGCGSGWAGHLAEWRHDAALGRAAQLD